MPNRAAFYIDGFNLYHAIDDLNEPHLKWLDFSALANLLIPSQSEKLVRLIYCTAPQTKDTAKLLRQRQFLKAQKARGVLCLEGHFADEERRCRACGDVWMKPTEKQGDVNLGIALIDDAYQDLYDHAYLVTADGDQAATARLFRQRFPEKKLTSVSPPGRRHSRVVLRHVGASLAINYSHIERSLFVGRAVFNNDGSVAAMRPAEYEPPPGWVYPHQRP